MRRTRLPGRLRLRQPRWQPWGPSTLPEIEQNIWRLKLMCLETAIQTVLSPYVITWIIWIEKTYMWDFKEMMCFIQMLEQVGKVIFKYMYSNHKTTQVLSYEYSHWVCRVKKYLIFMAYVFFSISHDKYNQNNSCAHTGWLMAIENRDFTEDASSPLLWAWNVNITQHYTCS